MPLCVDIGNARQAALRVVILYQVFATTGLWRVVERWEVGVQENLVVGRTMLPRRTVLNALKMQFLSAGICGDYVFLPKA